MALFIRQNQWHIVADGEDMLLIAKGAGFRNWLTIYNHDQNLEFRQENPNPYGLETGTRVWIPEKRPKELACETGKEHRFLAQSLTSQLNLVLESNPDKESTVRSVGTGESFDLQYEVPLIPQQTGLSAWAAAAAMLVAWRDEIAVDLLEIINGIGYWGQYKSALQVENPGILGIWGMVAQPVQIYSVTEFVELFLDVDGPLWVASAKPGAHIRVVTGLTGDGTPDGTTVYINDPWEIGMTAFRLPNAGAQYTESFAQFVQNQPNLAPQKTNTPGIYVAHLKES